MVRTSPHCPAFGGKPSASEKPVFHRHRTFSAPLLCLLIALIAHPAVSVADVERPRRNQELLLETYRKNAGRLESNAFGLPLFVDSSETSNRVQVDVYGVLNHPFNDVAGVLEAPKNWCDIVALHPNVKACTHREGSDGALLTFYLGRKGYQPPEDTRQVLYRYRTTEQRAGYLSIALDAEEGPYGTRDHKMRFEALDLDGARTFVRVNYSYNGSAVLRLAEKIYFATLGRGKVGFTVTGQDGDGNPTYVAGARGALERSAVRYYFAIHSFMNALRQPEEHRFTLRTSEWFDLTTRYKRQLADLDRKEYLAFKFKEHGNQVALQRRIGAVVP